MRRRLCLTSDPNQSPNLAATKILAVLQFHETNAGSDFSDYELCTLDRMRPEDRSEQGELLAGIVAGNVRMWSVHKASHVVGYCSVITPSPHLPWTGVHLLEVVVLESGHGYGTAIVDWLIARYRGVSLTASIRPDNAAAQRLAQRFGFRPGLPQGPWTTWHRLPDRSEQSAPLRALLTYEQALDPLPDFRATLIADAALEALQAQDYFAEIWLEGPQERRVARGLWPDPAAFDVSLSMKCTARPTDDLQWAPSAERKSLTPASQQQGE